MGFVLTFVLGGTWETISSGWLLYDKDEHTIGDDDDAVDFDVFDDDDGCMLLEAL